MADHGWASLLEVFDRLEGEIIKEALEAQGIPTQLFQEGVSHYLYPVSGPMGRIEICVPAGRLDEAKVWLEAFNNNEIEDDNPQTLEPGSDEL